MAFEDAYGEVHSTSSAKGYYDSVNADYLPMLLSLLPSGRIWEFEDGDEMRELLEALSYPYARLEERARDLIEEMDPRTAVETLPEWERVLDLPGTNPSPPSTLEGRRKAIHAKLLGHGDPTPAFFEAVAAGIGYSAQATQHFYRPFVAGSRVGESITNNDDGGWSYVWTLTTPSGADNALLEWTLEQIVPEHLELFFVYINWAARTSQFGTAAVKAFAYDTANGVYVAGGSSGKISTSPDGSTWTARTSNFGANQIWAMGYRPGNAALIAAGAAGNLDASLNGGATWSARTSQFGTDVIVAIAVSTVGGGTVVIVGTNGKASSSADGLTYVARTSQFGSDTIFAVVYGLGGQFIAVGAAGKISTSPDGATWTARASGVGSGDTLNAIAWGDDTSRWNPATDIAAAVGTSGKITTSVDGASWVPRDSGTTEDLYGVAYGAVRRDRSMFVVVGANGTILSSPDGINWTPCSNPLNSSLPISDVVYGSDGIFVVSNGAGEAAFSRDGVRWVSVDPTGVAPLGIDTLLHANGLLLAGGAGGKLSTAPYNGLT